MEWPEDGVLTQDVIDRRDYGTQSVNAAEQLVEDSDLIDDRFLDDALRRFLDPDNTYYEDEMEELVEQDEDRLDFWKDESDDFWRDKDYTPEWNTKREQRIAEETMEGSTMGSPGSFQAAQAATLPTKRWFKKHSNGRIPDSELMEVKGLGRYRTDAALAMKAMKRAAKKDGIILTGGGYRSYEEQAALHAEKPTLAAPAGSSEHGWGLASDIAVGDYDSATYRWLKKNGKKFGWVNPEWARQGGSKEEPWHWEWVGGWSPGNNAGVKKQQKSTVRRPKPRADYQPVGLVTGSSALTSASAMTEGFLSAVDELHYEAGSKRPSSKSSGKDTAKGVKGQLIAGFMDAGREDLAQMVRTGAFDTWIGQESGWRTHVVSEANNQGRPNGGLFQIWEGHEWARKYFKDGKFTASAYEQALLVAEHFSHLTAQKIRQYARAIKAGDYVGWG